MLVKIFGSAVFGIEAQTITIEVNIDQGIGYHLVGLPDNAIKESSYRIAAALKNINYQLPGKKITINMAPADLRKEGAAYDLPLAIGILISSAQIKSNLNLDKILIMGELSLDPKFPICAVPTFVITATVGCAILVNALNSPK